MKKQELKDALNFLVDKIYENKEDDKARLVKTTPVIDPRIKQGMIEGKKLPFISKNGKLLYEADMDMISDMLKEYKRYSSDIQDPKTIEIVESILDFNKAANVPGEGVVTEAQLYKLNLMSQELGYDTNLFLQDDKTNI